MQLDTFYMGLIQVSLLDGLALGLGCAFIITSICGLIITRRMDMSIIWVIGAILSLVIGVISGFLIMNLTEYIAVWSGSAFLGLSGSDLSSWANTIYSAFISYPYHGLTLWYIGSLAGFGMGYGIGVHPKEESTTFGVIFSILGICGLAIGLALALLPGILTLSTDFLYILIGLFSILFSLFAFRIWRRKFSEESAESSKEAWITV